MNLKKETQYLKQTQVLGQDEALKYHKKLIKLGRIFSEEYNCVFYIKEQNLRFDLTYYTENKNMQKQVEDKCRKDFPTAEIVQIVYC